MIAAVVSYHLAWLARARGVLATVLLTALAVALAGLIALHDAQDLALAASAILWLVVSLGALVAASRVLAAEEGTGGLQGLRLSPLDTRDLFLARTLAGLPLVVGLALLAWLVLIPFFPTLDHLQGLRVLPSLLLGALGLGIIGSLAGWAALSSRAGELLGPVLGLPMAAPLLVACLHATEITLSHGQVWGPSLTFALGYDLVVGALTYLVAPAIVEVTR